MARAERRLTELGTGNWNNRGIDNHVKRPAGVSSAGLKRMGMKRIDGIPHPVGCGNTSENMEASLKYPKQCLASNEHVYDGFVGRHAHAGNDPFDARQKPAGVEASKTVQFNDYAALSNPERDGPEGGKPPSWLLGQQSKRRVPCPWHDNRDPIKHDAVVPHYRGTRPIRRMGPHGNDGPMYDNGAAGLNWNLQHQNRDTGPLVYEGLSKEDWKAISKQEQISPLGEVVFKVGGAEDLRPCSTKEYTKADKPVSLLTQYENDTRQLAAFERERPTKKPEFHICMESPEMVKAMYHERSSSCGSRAPSRMSSEYRMSYQQSAASEYRGSLTSPREVRPSYTPSAASRPMSARESRQSRSLASFDSARSPERRRPKSARASATCSWVSAEQSEAGSRFYGSYRGNRSYAESSFVDDGNYVDNKSAVSSSYYYSESCASRRTKSLDRFSSSQRRGTYETGSPMSGMFSDPSRTVTESALNEALKSSRGPGRQNRSSRKAR